MANRKILRLLHIITGLERGGAEKILAELIAKHDRGKFKVTVVSLTDIGPVGKIISDCGVPVYSLDMRSRIPNPYAFFRLVRLIKRFQPNLIQTWMYHADLVGGLAALTAGNREVIWGVHHADPRMNKPRSKFIARICAVSSGTIPKQIVVCSDSALIAHASFGYDIKKMTVIRNGVDLEKFQPRRARRSYDVIVIGHVARWHTIKDHRSFISAAGIIHRHFPDARFVMVGSGVNQLNRHLVDWIQQAGIQSVTDLLGDRTDIPDLMNHFDIFVSSSLNESFALVVAEAMASGVPCVATDVGISSEIIGDTGRCIPTKDPHAMAAAIESILSLSSEDIKELGQQARVRIEGRFDLQEMVDNYESLYSKLVS